MMRNDLFAEEDDLLAKTRFEFAWDNSGFCNAFVLLVVLLRILIHLFSLYHNYHAGHVYQARRVIRSNDHASFCSNNDLEI